MCAVPLSWMDVPTLFLALFFLIGALPAQGKPIAVDGRAVDLDGRGIAGARVEMHALLPHSGPDAQAVTGPDGRFELTASGPGLWRVTVRADGYVPMQRRVLPLFTTTSLLAVELLPEAYVPASRRGRVPRPGQDEWEPLEASPTVPIVRPRGTRVVELTGQVISASPGAARRPLAGALVWPVDDPGLGVMSDEAGRFRLRGIAAGAGVELAAAALDHAQASLAVRRAGAAPRRPIVLALSPAPALHGTVVDAGGQPLLGAEVTLARRDEPDAWAARRDAHRARAAAAGAFRVPGLTAGGSYDVLVTHPGFAPVLTPVTIPKTGSPLGLDVVLSPGRTAYGTIVDSSGRPVEGARIELVRSQVGRTTAATGPPLAEDGLYRSTAGQDGRFDLSCLPPGCFDLRIEGDGFAPLERTGVEIPAGAGLLDLGRFFVERGAVLAGRVVDPEGQPLAGAEIWVVPRAPRDWTAYYKEGPAAVSGSDGQFTLTDLPREGGIGLDVCRKGFLAESRTIREPPLEPLRIVLDPAVRIVGRVLDPTGAPVAGAQIRAWLSGESPDRPVSIRPCRLLDATAETDAGGQFVLEALPPGWWTVRAEAAGWLSAETERRHVLAGASLDGVEIVLGAGAVLAGRVLAPDGAPLAGAEVRAYGERSDPRATTAGDGTYHLPGVEPGERTVEATHPDHELASRTLVVASGENRLDLQLGASRRSEIRGRVLGPDGRPLAGARVVIPASSSAYSAADGSFVLLEKDGTYEIWADKDGYAPGRTAEPVTVAERPVEGVEIRLTPGGAVTGRLLGLNRAQLSGARVEIDLQPPFQSMAAVDAQGGYRIADVPPGDWTVTATAGDRTLSDRVSLPPGQGEAALDFNFPQTWEVSGWVLGPAGEPVADATVRLYTPGGQGGWTYSRADGAFRLELEDGTYRGWVVRRGYFRAVLEEPVTVDGTPVDGVELRLGEEMVLRGRILGLEPGERAEAIWAEGPHAAFRQGELDQESGYAVYGLLPGDWKITASFQDREAVGRVTVGEGETAVGLDLEFAP